MNSLQRGDVERSYPLWLRVLAFACLVLIVGASSVQAVHIHGQWLPQRNAVAGAPADASQLPGGEQRCPLCMAMHSAFPVVSRVQPIRLLVLECRTMLAEGRAPEAHWHFAMFSRPPPVVGKP